MIITPHVGGQAATRIDDMTNFFCDNLARYLAGRPLRNLVDKQLGFPDAASQHRAKVGCLQALTSRVTSPRSTAVSAQNRLDAFPCWHVKLLVWAACAQETDFQRRTIEAHPMSMTTTLLHGTRTLTYGGDPDRDEGGRVNELLQHYQRMTRQPKLGWTEHLRLRRQCWARAARGSCT